jgi:hypothetical protein
MVGIRARAEKRARPQGARARELGDWRSGGDRGVGERRGVVRGPNQP